MVKKTGPSLKIERPPMRLCDTCNGNKAIQGMFYEMPCNACGATGVLHKETGEQIPAELVMILQDRRIKQLEAQVEKLKKHQPEFDPYGELKDKNGGKYRGD